MARRSPNLLSIPPGKPFLATLVRALLDGELISGFPDKGDPLSLARATLLLPTRRACRAVIDSFLDLGGPALLLPRIRAIADEDEEGGLIDEMSTLSDGFIDIPPAVPPLLRRTTLMRLILAWDKQRRLSAPMLAPMREGDAAALAGELGKLMDLMATQSVPWDHLDAILPVELQEHWQVAYDFLSLAREGWPRFLDIIGRVDPAERRRLVMEAELARLGRAPDRPVIAAGSTGSIPTTARLLHTIALLPKGAVVLPGYDAFLSDEIVAEIAGDERQPPVASHPQATLRSFIASFGKDADIAIRSLDDGVSPALRQREKLISRVMWPAEATGTWNIDRPDEEMIAAALDKVALVEAANEEEEALAIALIMREGLERPGVEIGLVTPDRALARRVAAELGRFGLAVDDTAGTPLSETGLGRLARLAAEAALTQCAPLALLSLLKHPSVRLALPRHLLERRISLLERAALRGLSPAPGIDGLRRALAVSTEDRWRAAFSPEERAEAQGLLDLVDGALSAFILLLQSREALPLPLLCEAHRAALAALVDGSTDEAAEAERLWQFFDELADTQESGLRLDPAGYPATVETLMRDQPVPARQAGDPRLKIYGLLEARLIRPQRLILAGLNEGVWPATARTDAWLSRGMRASLTLPAPEQRIGLSAHDFCQGLGAEEVFLSRALKSGTAPSTPSRWLQRLAAVIGAEAFSGLRQRGQAFVDLARLIDEPDAPPTPCQRPEPRPPIAARPRALSVTEIETLIRDPYAIYARHVLRLRPLEDVGGQIEGRERGTLIHACLQRASEALAADPATPPTTLLQLAEAEFAGFAAFPQVHALWWPRFRRVFDWFLSFDAARRLRVKDILIEASGRMEIAAPAGPFMLRGRADRIEIGEETVAIIDYKTGSLPGKGEPQRGFAPQLPLEAAMVARGGFTDIPPQAWRAAELLYVKLIGGNEAANEQPVEPEKGGLLADLVSQSWEGFVALIAAFDDEATAYASLAHTATAPAYNDYLHLARLGEWGVAGDRGEA